MEECFLKIFFLSWKLPKRKGYFGLKSSKSHSCRKTLTLWPGCWRRDSCNRQGWTGRASRLLRVQCSLSWWHSRNQHREGQRRNMGQESFEEMQSQVRQKEWEWVLRNTRGGLQWFLRGQTQGWLNFYKGTGCDKAQSAWTDCHLQGRHRTITKGGSNLMQLFFITSDWVWALSQICLREKPKVQTSHWPW